MGKMIGHNTYDGLKDAKDPSQGQKKIVSALNKQRLVHKTYKI
jgi:hypothetical protein